MAAIKSKCKLDYYPAFKSSGKRPNSAVKWIVMHSTETGPGTADDVARYFHSTAAKGSAHITVDDFICYRSLMNDDIPWGATGANTKGFHIEQVGRAGWSKEEWLKHRPTLERAAYKAAVHCVVFNIPPRFIGRVRLRLGFKGITTHAIVSKTFPGSGHWDPGFGWPRHLFMDLVKKYHKELTE